MNRDIANTIAGTTLTIARGTFFRHAWHGVKELKGSTGGGRWGPEHGFPVIYLGQPVPSVVVEAYRRLVDPVEHMRGDLVGPRVLLTLEADVDQLLDLRDPAHLAALGLNDDALRRPVAAVRACRARRPPARLARLDRSRRHRSRGYAGALRAAPASRPDPGHHQPGDVASPSRRPADLGAAPCADRAKQRRHRSRALIDSDAAGGRSGGRR